MKNSLIIFCFFLLSCSQAKDIIKVEYTPSSGVELLSSFVFEDVEIIPIYDNVFSTWGRLVAKNGLYYISGDDEKVHLFDASGKSLNSVGEVGRGPGEYAGFNSLTIEDNGDISIYSSAGILYTYSSDGRFLGSTEYPVNSQEFAKANGFNYHYFGNGSGQAYQLYISDTQNHIIDSCLAAVNATSLELGVVFSEYGNALNLCLPDDGDIYRLVDGKADLSYSFNFGMYKFSPAYYRSSSMEETFAYIQSSANAFKSKFLENQSHAILEVCVFDGPQELDRILYGILDKATSIWEWHYMNEGDFMDFYNLKYIDDSYLYFLAYPDMIIDANIAERFPALGALSEDCAMVILKCKLAT
jgi:hypothetical protein